MNHYSVIRLLVLSLLCGYIFAGPINIVGCETLVESGTYVLSSNFSSGTSENCITIDADNVILDGMNRVIEHTGRLNSLSAVLVNSNNVVIKNLGIKSAFLALEVKGRGTQILDCGFYDVTWRAVFLRETAADPVLLNNNFIMSGQFGSSAAIFTDETASPLPKGTLIVNGNHFAGPSTLYTHSLAYNLSMINNRLIRSDAPGLPSGQTWGIYFVGSSANIESNILKEIYSIDDVVKGIKVEASGGGSITIKDNFLNGVISQNFGYNVVGMEFSGDGSTTRIVDNFLISFRGKNIYGINFQNGFHPAYLSSNSVNQYLDFLANGGTITYIDDSSWLSSRCPSFASRPVAHCYPIGGVCSSECVWSSTSLSTSSTSTTSASSTSVTSTSAASTSAESTSTASTSAESTLAASTSTASTTSSSTTSLPSVPAFTISTINTVRRISVATATWTYFSILSHDVPNGNVLIESTDSKATINSSLVSLIDGVANASIMFHTLGDQSITATLQGLDIFSTRDYNVYSAGIEDPHFMGLCGRKYEVHGKGGMIYDIWTNKDFQLNSRFSMTEYSKIKTWMHDVSFITKGRQFWSNATTFMLDDEEMFHQDSEILDAQKNITLSIWKTRAIIRTPDFALEISQHPGKNDYMNIKIVTDDEWVDSLKEGTMHGILGQTAHHEHTQKELNHALRTLNGEGEIEGTVQDYEVSHIFAHDDKFSLYGKALKHNLVSHKDAHKDAHKTTHNTHKRAIAVNECEEDHSIKALKPSKK